MDDEGPHCPTLADYKKGVESVKKPYTLYTASEICKKFPPGAVNYGKNCKGMIEHEAGLLRADKGLRAFQVSRHGLNCISLYRPNGT